MIRGLMVAAIIAVLALSSFWVVTIPAIVPARALAPHTPDLANGKELFLVGGCASCHAVPKQPDKTKLGGGLALRSPFGTFYSPQHFTRWQRRHRRLERGAIHHRHDQGHFAGR